MIMKTDSEPEASRRCEEIERNSGQTVALTLVSAAPRLVSALFHRRKFPAARHLRLRAGSVKRPPNPQSDFLQIRSSEGRFDLSFATKADLSGA